MKKHSVKLECFFLPKNKLLLYMHRTYEVYIVYEVYKAKEAYDA